MVLVLPGRCGGALLTRDSFQSSTGSPPPDGLQGQRVVIVDFSYGRETLEMMAGETDRILILDHHITAEKALAGLPYAYFDMKKSGAVLAWEWAHDHPVPWLLTISKTKICGRGPYR